MPLELLRRCNVRLRGARRWSPRSSTLGKLEPCTGHMAGSKGPSLRGRPACTSATHSDIPYGGIVRGTRRLGRWQMPGYAGDKDQVLTRLRRIEGQVRGLQRLVDEDAYCIDVLTQITAVDKALKGVAVNLLDGHLRHCVREGMASGDREAEAIVTEATDAIARLVRA